MLSFSGDPSLSLPFRRLLDAELQRCIEEGQILSELKDSPVMQAILALLANDGLTRSVF